MIFVLFVDEKPFLGSAVAATVDSATVPVIVQNKFELNPYKRQASAISRVGRAALNTEHVSAVTATVKQK